MCFKSATFAARVELEPTSRVWPSGAERTTSIAAIDPPAPGLFSMTKGWPKVAVNCCPTARAATSLPEPGGNGTNRRTGRLG